jgi:hypothetical protein
MKRVRKLKVTGRISGKLRRRLLRRITNIRGNRGPGFFADTPWEIRDARRLVEAGLCAAAISKQGFVGRFEVALDVSRAVLRTRYTADAMMPGGRK